MANNQHNLILENLKVIIDQMSSMMTKRLKRDYNNISNDIFFKEKNKVVQAAIPVVISNKQPAAAIDDGGLAYNASSSMIDNATPSGKAWVSPTTQRHTKTKETTSFLRFASKAFRKGNSKSRGRGAQ